MAHPLEDEYQIIDEPEHFDHLAQIAVNTGRAESHLNAIRWGIWFLVVLAIMAISHWWPDWWKFLWWWHAQP